MITLIDYNKMQSYGHIKDILELEPLKEKNGEALVLKFLKLMDILEMRFIVHSKSH